MAARKKAGDPRGDRDTRDSKTKSPGRMGPVSCPICCDIVEDAVGAMTLSSATVTAKNGYIANAPACLRLPLRLPLRTSHPSTVHAVYSPSSPASLLPYKRSSTSLQRSL